MVLLRIKHKEVFDLQTLTYLVLNFIYEPKTMSLDLMHSMQDSLNAWAKKFPIEDFELERVQSLCWLVVKNEEGALENRKRMFKEKHIDWRKFHRIPGANSPEEIFKAEQMYKKYKEKNFEQEDMSPRKNNEN